MTDPLERRTDARSAIVAAAATLLHDHGAAAVTTRAVAEAAGVQAPAIYRLFGDKDGLLEAVAEHVLAAFVATKTLAVAAARDGRTDPVEDLRTGWRQQIEFGLTHPAVFGLLSDPERAGQSAAARSGWQVLADRVHRIAAVGRLRVSEARAAHLVHAAGTGVVLTLVATPPAHRDPGLAEAMLAAVLGQILRDAPTGDDDPALGATVAFRAALPDLTELTDAERRLAREWTDRVADARERDRV